MSPLTLAASLIGLTVWACGGKDTVGPGTGNRTVTVASVVLTPGNATLVSLGQTVQLSASASDASGNTISGKTFTWSSSDESLAIVSSSGLVTAVANGSVTITATTDGVNGTATILVDQVAVSVLIVPSTAALVSLDETIQLTPSAQDAGGNAISGNTFVWSSSDESIATVSASGLVTAVTNGSVSIMVTTDGVNAAAAVEVAQVPASLQVTPGIFSADEFTTQTFQVLFTDANGFAVPSVSFLVSADSGVGSVSPESGTTNQDGIASVSWTLGGYNETETGIEAITISTPDGSLGHTSIIRAMPFSAVQCLDFEHSGFWISAGGCGYDARPTGSSFDVTFRVTASDYTPIVGAIVTFEVDPTCLGLCDNPGSVSVTSAITDSNGQVTVTWTLGPNEGSNRLLVGYQSGTVGVWARGQ